MVEYFYKAPADGGPGSKEVSMQVKDVMTKEVICVQPDETVAVASRLMARHNLGVLAVCSPDGKLRGMVTDRDVVLRCVAADEDPAELKVKQVMTRRVVTVDPEDSLETASKRMAAQQVRRLPVERDGRLAGMVSLADLTRAPELRMEVAEALCDICDPVRKQK